MNEPRRVIDLTIAFAGMDAERESDAIKREQAKAEGSRR